LLLAQELLEQPKMSNHARGLWGYSGQTAAGMDLTIQSTGMGGPSAAIVLADLAELGVRRAVRVGSCVASVPGVEAGMVLVVEAAIAEGGSATAFGMEVGDRVEPDPALTGALRAAIGEDAPGVAVASFDSPPGGAEGGAAGSGAADMQTAAVLARARSLGIAAAALLIALEEAGEPPVDEELRDDAARRAGRAAIAALST
jgi:uridine phosphorylase